MSEELYLESVLRDRLGITDSLMKKTRRDVVEAHPEFQVAQVIINGRSHAAYARPVIEEIVCVLNGKKTRAPGGGVALDAGLGEILDAALIQGVPVEIQGTEKLRSDEIELRVRLITGNRFVMLADHPDGEDLDPVRLRVKDTTMFVHGMDVPGCRHVEADLYEFAGRQPRSRGRW